MVTVNPKQWGLDILLAEDDPHDIELFKIALKQCGHVQSLNVVRDGEELIDYLQGKPPFVGRRRVPPTVIFMDLKMPKLNGFDVLRWLKKHPACGVIPTIMLSGSALEQDVRKAYQLGVNAFFNKPTHFGELAEILELTFNFWSRCERPVVTVSVCA
jgi:CheY-like chemotaxis protein